MYTVKQPPTKSSDELSLREFLAILQSGKWLILVVTLLVTGGATAAAYLIPKTYEANVVVLPVAGGSGSGSLSSLASKVGGLASLLGVSAGTDYKRTESIAVLKSNALIRRYITTHNLIPILYSSKWNASLNKWKDPQNAPTLWDATQYFKKSIRTITVDGKTGLVTVSVHWRNPTVAATWANGLVQLTNDYLRQRAIKEANRDINYLGQEAQQTNVVQLKRAIFTVLQYELEQSMLARGTKEYAVTIIDPAVAPGQPRWPDKKLWIAVGIFLGLLCSCFFVIFRAALGDANH
jgi:uncharacterized protein involved in exopolysaccharide biosynthesis